MFTAHVSFTNDSLATVYNIKLAKQTETGNLWKELICKNFWHDFVERFPLLCHFNYVLKPLGTLHEFVHLQPAYYHTIHYLNLLYNNMKMLPTQLFQVILHIFTLFEQPDTRQGSLHLCSHSLGYQKQRNPDVYISNVYTPVLNNFTEQL